MLAAQDVRAPGLASVALAAQNEKPVNVPGDATQPHATPPSAATGLDEDPSAGAVLAAEAPSEDVLSTSAAGPAALRGSAMRLGAFIAASLASVLSASLLFRHLGVSATGEYVTALTLTAIVAALSDLGLTSLGVRELSVRPPEERWRLARDLLGLRITLTVIGGVVVTAIAAAVYSATLAAGVALACVGLLLQATQDNLGLTLVIDLRLGWIAVLEFSRQILTTLAIISLVVIGASLVPFLGVSIPVGLAVLGLNYALVRGVRSLSPTFSLRRWRVFTRAMLPYALAVAASALYFRVSILLVSVLSDKLQLGYFSASFRVIEVLTAVPTLLVGSALPIFARAARDDHDRLGYALGRVSEAALIVGVWLGVSIAVGAPLAIAIIGGPEFKPAAPILAIQGISLAAMFVSQVWANGLLSLGLFRAILAVNIAVLVLNAALVSALVPLDGARGAAIGTAVAEIAAALLQAFVVIRRRPQLRPSLRRVPLVLLAGAVGLAPLALTGLPVIVRVVISTTVYVGVVIVTHAYPEELLDLIPRAGPLARLRGSAR